MLKNSLIIIPFQLPWDWSADYQSQTCLELAKKNKKNLVIAYINEDARFFLKAKPPKAFPKKRNLLFYQPRYFIPLRRFAWIEKLNQLLNVWYLLIRYGSRRQRSILWIFDHNFWFFPRVKWVFPRLISLYDCVDYIWHRTPSIKKIIQAQEKQLINSVNFFLVNSRALAKLHAPTRKPTGVVPQGFRSNDFSRPKPTTTAFPKDKPTIGYLGAINHRLNFKLLRKLIKNNSQWHFIFWGPIQETEPKDALKTNQQVDVLSTLANITFGQSADRRELPNIIKQFDVCMVPYDVSLVANKYAYPMKIFEYFYVGKPVVSTPIDELAAFPKFVKFGNSAKEWQLKINLLLKQKWGKTIRREQRKISLANSWENKISAIGELIKNQNGKR